MPATANLPKFFWAIVSLPIAFLIISLGWFIFTYASVIKSAEIATLTTPIGTITTRFKAIENNVQSMLDGYSQLLTTNNQLINQFEVANKPHSQSISTYSYSVHPLKIPAILNSLKNQSTLLQEQQQRLQGISMDLLDVKQQVELMGAPYGKSK